MLSPNFSFSNVASSSTQSPSNVEKIPVSLSQLHQGIRNLPDGIREQAIPRDTLFLELNKPLKTSARDRFLGALSSFREQNSENLFKNLLAAWKKPPAIQKKERTRFLNAILLTASSQDLARKNNEYLKEALRMGNQPLFNLLLRKTENPELAPLIQRAVIDENETAFSEIIKSIDKTRAAAESNQQLKPLPKDLMNWLAEYGKPEKLATLLEKMPPDSYTAEEREEWTSLAERQQKTITDTKGQEGVLENYAQLSLALQHFHNKANIKSRLASIQDQNSAPAQELRASLDQLQAQDSKHRLNFMAHSQNMNPAQVFQLKYLGALEKALLAKDNKSLDLMLNIPKFCLVDSSAFNLPIIAASIGNLEGLQRVLDTPKMSVNQMFMSESSLHAAAKHGHQEIVEHLLKRMGIDKNLKDFSGQTALDLARENGHEEIVKLLEESNPQS